LPTFIWGLKPKTLNPFKINPLSFWGYAGEMGI